ncbi:hypothetical protein ACP3WI_25270, partial [Salmonella enterica]|uniref:hypothetical protein n=1 Tax=Salmonella enterica TaxID=28901 RepID=UPI003CE9D108
GIAVVFLDRVDGQRLDVHSDLRRKRGGERQRKASRWPAAHAVGPGIGGSLVGWLDRSGSRARPLGRSSPQV